MTSLLLLVVALTNSREERYVEFYLRYRVIKLLLSAKIRYGMKIRAGTYCRSQPFVITLISSKIKLTRPSSSGGDALRGNNAS